MGRLGELRAGVDAVASVVDQIVVTAGDALADVVETGGSLVRDGLVRVPVVGAWLGGIVAGLLNVVGAVVKGATGIVGGVPAGVVRVVGGIVLWNGRLVVRGFVGIGSSIGGAVLVVSGIALATLQRVVLAEGEARPLSDEEGALLRKVFGRSLALYNVRVVQGRSGAFGFNRRPFTLGNTIYLKDVDLSERMDVLVHEAVHVWQYQHEGSRYTTDALGVQVFRGYSGRGAYDWRAELARGRTSWREFNKESQGSFIQDLWKQGRGAFFAVGGAGSFVVDGVDHTAVAVAARDALQGRRNLRPSLRRNP